MDDPSRALRVSLALKAARFLAGGKDEKGRATALSTAQLAQRRSLAENGITKNRLEDFEQMRATARPMELDQISRALGIDMGALTDLAAVAAGTMDADASVTAAEAELVERLPSELSQVAAGPRSREHGRSAKR